jgi:phosphoenolpyruvate carboxykinase (ATP)
VAGTERGLSGAEATFSTCFGAPFMTLPPNSYGRLLAEKIRRHAPDVWLINTGWTGGGYGAGERISIAHTRAIVHAALGGELRDVSMQRDPIFGVFVPTSVPGVPSEVLIPSNTWADKSEYVNTAKALARSFHENFARYATDVDEAIREAGPKAE